MITPTFNRHKILYPALASVFLIAGVSTAYALDHQHLPQTTTNDAKVSVQTRGVQANSVSPSGNITTQGGAAASTGAQAQQNGPSPQTKSPRETPDNTTQSQQTTSSVLGDSTSIPNVSQTTSQPSAPATVSVASSNSTQATTCSNPTLLSPYVRYATAYPVGTDAYGNIYSTQPMPAGTTITTMTYSCSNGLSEVGHITPFPQAGQ